MIRCHLTEAYKPYRWRARRASIPRLPALFSNRIEGRRSIHAELRAPSQQKKDKANLKIIT